MDKMSTDTFEWTQHLGCPLSASFQEHEKRLLNHGVVSFAWDEISARSLPIQDALEVRQNILLYYIRNNMKIPAIEHAHNIKRLKTERINMKTRIEIIENELEEIYESIQQKSLKNHQIKSLKHAEKMKKMAIDFKHEEIERDKSTCNELLLECHNLLPSYKDKINESVMHQSLALVGTISCRQDKREAWSQISDNLGSINIAELWKWLLNKRIQDTNKLTQSEFQCPKEEQGVNIKIIIKAEQQNGDGDDKKILNNTPIAEINNHHNNSHDNITLAKAYGKHVLNTIETMMHLCKAKEYQDDGVNYVEKIFLCERHKIINNWLELVLQIPQLEKRRKILKHHIDELNSINEEEEILRTQYSELSCQLNETVENLNQCVKSFEVSLVRLKPGGQFLFQIKDHLMILLNNISTLLHSYNNAEWLNINLNTELDEFHNNLNINALNKIMLANVKSPYRHAFKCINSALLTMTKYTPAAPIYQIPVYHIIDCLKNMTINTRLKQEKQEMDAVKNLAMILIKSRVAPIPATNRKHDIQELLDSANSTTEKCQEELQQLDDIYDAWAHQPVQTVMEIIDNVAHKATFAEWIKRYTTLVYMIQRNK